MKILSVSLILLILSFSASAKTERLMDNTVIWKNPNTHYITCPIPMQDYGVISTQYCYAPIKRPDYINGDSKKVSPQQYASLLGWTKVHRIGLTNIANQVVIILEVSK